MNLRQSFQNLASRLGLSDAPIVINNIRGFDFNVRKMDGVLLTTTVDGEKKPASEGSYYLTEATPTGENPEYPARDKPYTSQVTAALQKSAGYVNGVNFVPAGFKPVKFVLSEEFFDTRQAYMGRATADHHTVSMRAHFENAKGEKTSFSVGYEIRKSDQPAVEAMRGCPVHYF